MGFHIIKGKWRTSDVATVASLAVSSKHQGKGIARKVMESLEEKLKLDGVRRIQLSAEVDNPRAISFYEKLGFEREGVLKQYLDRQDGNPPVDNVMMGKILTS